MNKPDLQESPITSASLALSLGQYSTKGKKPVNQDFQGAVIPLEPDLTLQGAAFALADGISSSDVSQVASQISVNSFLDDYFCTSEAWSAKTSGIKVIEAINGWLAAQTQKSEYRFNKDKGYVCTFSALVVKAKVAHLFHVGDSRIYLLRNGTVEQLTKDHRTYSSSEHSYLSRALGVNAQVEVDYHAIEMQVGDYFLLCTDGVHEYCSTDLLLSLITNHQNDLDSLAESIALAALQIGSEDNISLQIVKVEELATSTTKLLAAQHENLSVPTELKARQTLDGYTIERQLHVTNRSQVFLAKDNDTQAQVVIKIPSNEMREDARYIERFVMEEWIASRINSAHVVKTENNKKERTYLYSVSEYINGISLKQWSVDNPCPDIETVRGIIEQIARGLQAIHRLEILHQDLKPDNIMIDRSGTVKIIDFGAARIAGVAESQGLTQQQDLLGTALYTAPEYFIGSDISVRSEQFSLAMIAYNLLSGRFPYGIKVAKARTLAAQKRLKYDSVLDPEREIPAWVDHALRKALHPNPHKRYAEISEFMQDLRQANQQYLSQSRLPLIERKPLAFYKGVSLLLLMIVFGLLIYINQIT